MSKSVCFTTVCSSNHFQYFIPVFLYSIKKAYPDAGVKIFVKGLLKDEIKAFLNKLRTEKLITDDWDVLEGKYTSYPSRPSTCNCLRFLIKRDHFKDYDYIIVSDIDFIVLPHETSHVQYFAKRMKAVGTCLFSFRGPYNRPRRPQINHSGWKGDYSRIAGGTVILKNPEWFDKTENATREYRTWLKESRHDDYDGHVVGSYRENDEVMLYRICKKSHIKVPTKKNKGPDGKGVSKIYRDIHLGDFSKKKRRFGQIRRKIANDCVKPYMLLEKDPIWQEAKAVAGVNPKVRKVLRRALKHIQSR